MGISLDIIFTIIGGVCCYVTVKQTMQAKGYKDAIEKSFYQTNLIELKGIFDKSLKKMSKFRASCTEDSIRGLDTKKQVDLVENFLELLKKHKTFLQDRKFLENVDQYCNKLNDEIRIFVSIDLDSSSGKSDLIVSGHKIYNALNDISHKFSNIEIGTLN